MRTTWKPSSNKTKLTFLALALLITVLVGNAYGDPWDAWDDEKAKSIGLPVVPVDTVIICESELRTGFDWENGTYRQAFYKNQKHILKKVEPFKGCYGMKPDPLDSGFDPEFGYHKVCFKHHIFGEKPRRKGGKCSEEYRKREDGNWDIRISCRDTTYTPKISFSPNGFYHLSFLHDDVSSKPKDNYKDSQLIEWGKCATISP